MSERRNLKDLQAEIAGRTPEAVLSWAAARFPGQIAFSSSLGAEDQVLTDMLVRFGSSMPVFTLDTGRLFAETYDLLARTEARYGIKLTVYFPDPGAVEQMVNSHGINLFRHSVEERKRCCQVRKIQPLRRALSGLEAWVTGLRRGQSMTRSGVEMLEWDETNGLLKINPLADWEEKQVWDYVREHNVPYNVLHDRGFPSIGCSPCTRAVAEGDDPRSGRWWWERPEHRECGLHSANSSILHRLGNATSSGTQNPSGSSAEGPEK